jgi:hypothetical protein
MTNVYYEIADSAIEIYGSKYIARYNVPVSSNDTVVVDHYFKLVLNSTRIWRQDGDEVRFIKHRWGDFLTVEVDPVEFTLIVLKSVPA